VFIGINRRLVGFQFFRILWQQSKETAYSPPAAQKRDHVFASLYRIGMRRPASSAGCDKLPFGRTRSAKETDHEEGDIIKEDSVGTTKKALLLVFGQLRRCRVAIEVGDTFAVGESTAQEPRV
jgi:hypothetical protein